MTANVLPQQITAYREAGMTDHVGKPFKRDELYAVVERAMKTGMERGLVPSTPSEAPLEEPVLDKAIIDELEGVGGAAMVERLLDQFATNYRTRFVDLDRAQIARDAHALVSSAGMLGLTRLSQACVRLEKACGDGGTDVMPVLVEVRAEAEAALDAASAWRHARG
jgi:HPt (histidine-containing phosphotransfer) domain-containing protein